MKVLNFGSLNLDYVYQVNSILIPGKHRHLQTGRFFVEGKD